MTVSQTQTPPKSKTQKQQADLIKKIISKVIIYLVLVLITIVTLLPLVWMLSSSLKKAVDVFSIPIAWIPTNPKWDNYAIIFDKISFGLFTFNTAKLTVITTAIQLATSSLAAYGFAKCKFKGRDVLFLCYVATIAIPWQAYMLPQYIFMQNLKLTDTHLALILLQSFNAFGVFLMRQYFRSIPEELLESARIDGMTEMGIFIKIVIPLSMPAVASLVIFSFVSIWNDYMGPMIYINSTDLKTIQLGLQMFMGEYGSDYGLVMAASVVSLLPVIAVFLACQKFFIQGIASSGMKD